MNTLVHQAKEIKSAFSRYSKAFKTHPRWIGFKPYVPLVTGLFTWVMLARLLYRVHDGSQTLTVGSVVVAGLLLDAFAMYGAFKLLVKRKFKFKGKPFWRDRATRLFTLFMIRLVALALAALACTTALHWVTPGQSAWGLIIWRFLDALARILWPFGLQRRVDNATKYLNLRP